MIHGLIHLMGFARAFRLATIEQFTREITKPVGLLWLVSGLLFLVVTALFLMKREAWPLVAIIAVVLSQILILFYWQDARFGTIANVIIAGVAISSFESMISIAIIFAAPAMRQPWIMLRPIPPQPITATLAPPGTFAVYRAAPTPVITPQPISAVFAS